MQNSIFGYKRRRRALRLTWLLVMPIALAGCGTSGEGAGPIGTDSTEVTDDAGADDPGTESEAQATDVDDETYDVDITVSTWPLVAETVPFMMEEAFREAGVNINSVVGSEGGGTTVRNVLVGDLDFGLVGTPAAVQAYMSGAPLVGLGSGVQGISNYCIAALSDSPIQSLTEAVENGASIGYTNPASGSHIALALALQRNGYEFDEVDARATDGMAAGLTLAQAGDIDATSLFQPFAKLPVAEGLECFYHHSEDVPLYQQLMIVTSPDHVEENPDLVRAFLRGYENAVDSIIDDPGAAAAIWAEVADIDEAVAQATLEGTPLDTEYAIGVEAEALSSVEEGMRAIGLIGPDEPVPWSEFVNQDFLPDGANTAELSELSGE